MREVSAALPGPANGTFREECSDTFADFADLVHFVFPMTRGRWFDFAVTNDFVDHRLAGHLRSIPLNDPDFSRLYGLREDTESMHNDYKSRLVNRRAGSVGLARREMDIRGYQMFQMVVALMAWKIRTGGDVSEFLGQWEPPERARRRNDA